MVSKTVTINNQKENREMQLGPHTETRNYDENQIQVSWKSEIEPGKQFKGYCVNFINMMYESESKWGRLLECNNSAKHIIHLMPSYTHFNTLGTISTRI